MPVVPASWHCSMLRDTGPLPPWCGRSRSLCSRPLAGASCTSSKACTAIGGYYEDLHNWRIVADPWNGKDWTTETTPDTRTAASTLSGVSCTSRTACVAVGSRYTGRQSLSFAEAWNGKRSSVQAAPDAGLFGSLNGVSCTSPTACIAVGVRADGTNELGTLAERWNGQRWAVQVTRDPSPYISILSGISCTSANACTAVGTHTNDKYARSMT